MAKKFRGNKNLENFCLSIIRWGTYLILFTPLIIWRVSFFPFVTPKTIYFRILVEIISAAYLFLAISFSQYRPRIDKLSITIFLFLCILVLTSFTGINFVRSFWSTYERMTGLFTMFHLLAFFIILTSVFQKREDWEKILATSIIVGVLLSLYVLLTPQQVSTRGGGTIGNTSFMATYLLFDIFFAIILFLAKRGNLQIFSGISLAILLPTLLTSSARGAIISFSGGLLLLILGYLLFSEKKNLKRAGIISVSSLIIFGIILVIYQPSFIKNKIGEILRDMGPRFVVWKKGWKGFLERPILGWGPENFNVVFLKYFNPCMFLSKCGGEIWFDRVHNVVFDTLVTTGIIGFLSYLSIFAVSIFGLFKICLKEKDYNQPATLPPEGRAPLFFALGMMVLLVVYFFQNLLVFDMISSYTVFFLSLGFISFLTKKKENLPEEFRERQINSFLGSLILVFTIFLLYFGNIQPAQSAINTVKMIIPDTNLGESINFFKKALNTFMEKYEIREQFAQRVLQEGFKLKENQEVLRSAFSLAEEEMEKSIKKNPLDFRPHLFLGQLYFSDYYFSKDNTKLDLAEKTLEKAITLSQTNQQGYWHLAEVKFSKDEREESFNLFQKAIDLEPKLGKSHWYLAMVYKAAGLNAQALGKIKEAQGLGYNWKENLEDLKRVIEIYQALGDDQNLILLYQKAIEFDSKNASFWANLAASYANLGEYEKAKEAAKKVEELDPNLAPKVEEFLKSLPE